LIDEFISRTVLNNPQRHNQFYHFTDSKNIASIKQNGILSTKFLRERGIQFSSGGNDWSKEADQKCGMDGYVHLCLTCGHPMVKRAIEDKTISDLVWLRIVPDVIKLPGVLITQDVANKSGIIPKGVEEALLEMDKEVIYTRTNWADPAINARLQKAERWEILVPDLVATQYIRNLNG
jgi:hypothetical protein